MKKYCMKQELEIYINGNDYDWCLRNGRKDRKRRTETRTERSAGSCYAGILERVTSSRRVKGREKSLMNFCLTSVTT